MEIKIERFKGLIESKGFQEIAFKRSKRSIDDFIENIIICFKKEEILIEIRLYVGELIIRFKNIDIESNYIDIRSLLFYYETDQIEKVNINFIDRLFIKEVELSLLEDLDYYFLKKKFDELLYLLNKNNFDKTHKSINEIKDRVSSKDFTKVFFSKKNYVSLLKKYKN